MSKPSLAAIWLIYLVLNTSQAFAVLGTNRDGIGWGTTKIEDVPFELATFQSHNTKVVSTNYGIFMTYSYSDQLADPSKGTWRLARSIDGGSSFSIIYHGDHSTKPPVLDSDQDGNIYLIHSQSIDISSIPAKFYKFSPENGFKAPVVVRDIPGASTGKYTMQLDRARQRIYFITLTTSNETSQLSNFFALDYSGNLVRSKALIKAAPDGKGGWEWLQYPHLDIDANGRLYFAWVTLPDNPVAGLAIQYKGPYYVYSDDGGDSWRSPSYVGAIPLPFYSNDNGPGLRVIAATDQNLGSNYLSNMTHRDGYLHFSFQTRFPNGTYKQNYVSYTAGMGQQQGSSLISGFWNGGSISIAQDQGFFVNEIFSPNFFTSPRLLKLGITTTADGIQSPALISRCTGCTNWSESGTDAVSLPLAKNTEMKGLSGNRQQSDRKEVLGMFTRRDKTGAGNHNVWFLYKGLNPSPDLRTNLYFGKINFSAAAKMSANGYGYLLQTDLGTRGNTIQLSTNSKVVVYENGVRLPDSGRHAYHTDIDNLGRGRYSHWNTTDSSDRVTGQYLYFSTSDNSDPRTNGRVYTYGIERDESHPCGHIHANLASSVGGYAYILPMPAGTPMGDSNPENIPSTLELYENGVRLQGAHSSHSDIINFGQGRFSHWYNGSGNYIYFSSSDGTDPRTNGRIYSFGGPSCSRPHYSQ